MKKRIALSVVLSVLAVTAFAEISVSGQFDAILVPLQILMQKDPPAGQEEITVGAGLGRDGSAATPRARIGVVASDPDEKIGLNFKVQFNMHPDSGSTGSFRVAFDDFAEVWVKPIDWLRIDVGRFVNDTLRGKIGDDNWQHYTLRMSDPDAIFSRFRGPAWDGTDGGGFLVSLTPVEGLFIGLGVPGMVSFRGSGTGFGSGRANETIEKLGYAYQRIQAGIGYNIKDIGLIRAQFVGSKPRVGLKEDGSFDISGGTIVAPKIEAAFAFTMIEGLVLDLGGKIPIAFSEWHEPVGIWDEEPDPRKGVTYQAPIQISLGAGFTAGDLDIKARVDTKLAGYVEPDNGLKTDLSPVVNFHLWPSYNLGFATLGVDVGLEIIGKAKVDGEEIDKTDGVRVGFGAWLKKSIGSCSVKGGLAYRVGTEVYGQNEHGAFTIPFVFETSF